MIRRKAELYNTLMKDYQASQRRQEQREVMEKRLAVKAALRDKKRAEVKYANIVTVLVSHEQIF